MRTSGARASQRGSFWDRLSVLFKSSDNTVYSITGGLRSSASNLMNDALSQQRARFDESASLPGLQQAFSQSILDFYLVVS